MMFFSRTNLPSTVPSSIGSFERSVFEERIVNGKKRLVVTGKENVKDFIEASKSECLIDNILKRFENGDINALSKVQGFYGDVSGMPTNLMDAKNLMISLENKFNSFPVDIKKKFDNSFDSYLQAVSHYSVDDFYNVFLSDKLGKKTNVNTSESVGDSVES